MKKSIAITAWGVSILFLGSCSGLVAQGLSSARPGGVLHTAWTRAALDAAVPFPEYPRPQMERGEWMNLNGKWDYRGGKDVASALEPAAAVGFGGDGRPGTTRGSGGAGGPDGIGGSDGAGRAGGDGRSGGDGGSVGVGGKVETIRVPYCPESVLSGIQRPQEINMWYRRKFVLPAGWKGKQVILHFEAVAHAATIFVNGHKVGSHIGSYDAFSFDITSSLRGGENELICAVQDLNDGRVPSGKSGPRGDYTFCSGIWQSVWLEPVSKAHIEGVRLLPDLGRGGVRVSVSSVGGKRVMAVVFDGDKEVARVESATSGEIFLPIKSPKPWSPEDPFLYDLRIKLDDADEVKSYFGMRDIKLGKIDGVTRPLINGKFVMQLGLLDQGYWPDGILTAPTEEALKYDMEFAKKAGFNLIRKHMKTEPQRFYYWADKMGLLVWQDMPAIWYQDEDTARVRSEFRKELKTLIDQHYNSPSIITWVPFNENWGAFDVRSITDWVRQYDPSRLVNGNSGFNNNPSYQKAYGDPGNGDYVDEHIYVGPYGASKPEDHRAASLGEFGGVGLFVRGHMWPVMNNAYDYEPTVARLTDRYVFLLDEVEQLMRYKGLSVAIYTQTTDVEHEVNGILTYDRAVEKMEVDRVRAVNEAVIKAGYELGRPE